MRLQFRGRDGIRGRVGEAGLREVIVDEGVYASVAFCCTVGNKKSQFHLRFGSIFKSS